MYTLKRGLLIVKWLGAEKQLWFDNKVGYIDCENKERNRSI